MTKKQKELLNKLKHSYVPSTYIPHITELFTYNGVNYGRIPRRYSLGKVSNTKGKTVDDVDKVYVIRDKNRWRYSRYDVDGANLYAYESGNLPELSTWNENSKALNVYSADSPTNLANWESMSKRDEVNREIADRELSKNLSSYTVGNFLGTMIPLYLGDPMHYVGALGETFRGNGNILSNIFGNYDKGLFSLSNRLSNWADEHPYLSTAANLAGSVATFGLAGAGKSLFNSYKPIISSYVKHPTWLKYQHGSPNVFNITEARTGSFNNIGLHASRANNNVVALDFGSNGKVSTFRAPRWKSETVDIDNNNFRLLDPNYRIKADERLLNFGPGSKLKHKLLDEAGSGVYYGFDELGGFNGVFNLNDVTINLLKLFKGLKGSLKDEADAIVSKGKLLLKQWENQTVSFEDYDTLITNLNKLSADLLNRSGNDVIRYNNDIEGVGKPGTPLWSKSNYSYIITDPSKVDPMIRNPFNFNVNELLPYVIPQIPSSINKQYKNK